MSRFVGLVVICLVVCLPATASEPGNPLDCTDWVFLKPSLRCVEEIPRQCDGQPECDMGELFATDNEGHLVFARRVPITICDGTFGFAARMELVISRNGVVEVVAYLEDRCGVEGTSNLDVVRPLESSLPDRPLFRFDNTNGRLLIPLESLCRSRDTANCSGVGDYDTEEGFWLAAIEGFPSIFDINQSYAPAPGQLSFTVPYSPEGFQSANYFDTYWGDLATVGDWAQAQPLQCGYPATPPSVGDYLTVDDTLPTPAPGRGYYYVTAVNYQGQRRYGRQASAGVLSGRNPGVLPVCTR